MTGATRRMFTVYSYNVNKRPLTNYGFSIHKDDHQLPTVNKITFGGSAWLKLKNNDEIMRINSVPVWNKTEEEIQNLINSSEGHVNLTLRRA